MRYYYLTIGSKQFILDEKNPSQVRLVFNISTTDNVEYSRPSIITLYNVDIDFFTSAKQYKKQTLLLRAGVKGLSPFGKRQSLEIQTDDIIYMGLVDDVITSWEGRETKVSFLGRTLPNMKFAKQEFQQVASIEAGRPVAQAIALLIVQYLQRAGKNIVVEIDDSAYGVITKQKQTLPIRPPADYIGGLRYFSSILRKFKLQLMQDNNVLKITAQDTLLRAIPAGVNLVSKTSLLSQPVYENFETISLQVALNGKYRINQYIMLPNEIPLATGNLGSAGGLIQRSASNDSGFLLMQGVFLVVESHHIGDSRNNDAMSWATNILCVRQIF